MRTVMERSNSSYKERGSEASTADSLGIKDAAKESSKGQNFEQRTAGNAGLTELVVHEALGIDSRASMEMNLAGFQQMTVDTGEFTYEQAVFWLQMLSKVSRCKGIGDCAEAIAHRAVVEEGMDNGRSWINASKDTWSFMKKVHYMMLQEYGFGRTWTQEYGYQRAGPDQMNMVQMELGQDEIQMELEKMYPGAGAGVRYRGVNSRVFMEVKLALPIYSDSSTDWGIYIWLKISHFRDF